MSARLFCDHCEEHISDEGEYFGVDHTRAIADYSTGSDEVEHEGEGTEVILLRPLVSGHEFHLCSVDCLTSWAMGRMLDKGGVP